MTLVVRSMRCKGRFIHFRSLVLILYLLFGLCALFWDNDILYLFWICWIPWFCTYFGYDEHFFMDFIDNCYLYVYITDLY